MFNIVICILWYLLIGAIYVVWSLKFINAYINDIINRKGVPEPFTERRTVENVLLTIISVIFIFLWPYFIFTVLFKVIRKIVLGE